TPTTYRPALTPAACPPDSASAAVALEFLGSLACITASTISGVLGNSPRSVRKCAFSVPADRKTATAARRPVAAVLLRWPALRSGAVLAASSATSLLGRYRCLASGAAPLVG